jgi:Sugar-specific transcriptional regulator TrmB
MPGSMETNLGSLFGSRARALTLAVLANAEGPLTGYRIAQVASLPRPKVYAVLRQLYKAGFVQNAKGGVRLTDPDLRSLLQKRLRLRWSEEWDSAREGWSEENPRLLSAGLADIRTRIRRDPDFLRPRGWKPPPSARKIERELRRPASKDAGLRRRGLRTSDREDWAK